MLDTVVSLTTAHDALEYMRDQIDQISEQALVPTRVTAQRAIEQSRTLHLQFKPLLPQLESHLAPAEVQRLVRKHTILPRLALAYYAAYTYWERYELEDKAEAMRQLEHELCAANQHLTRWALLIFAEQPAFRRRVEAITLSAGPHDCAHDVVELCSLILGHWPIIQKDGWVGRLAHEGLTPDTLQEQTARARHWIRESLPPQGLSERHLTRRQAYTALHQCFETLTHAGRFLAPRQDWPSLHTPKAHTLLAPSESQTYRPT